MGTSTWLRHEPWLVLVPEGTRPELLSPHYSLDSPSHTAVGLEGDAALYVYLDGVMMPGDPTGKGAIAAMFVDPWGRGVVAQGSIGEWVAN